MTLQEQRKELETVLVNKAETDADFRAAILADPKPILKKEFGLSFSDDCRVSVHQETPTHFHLVLPLHLQGELSDEALEAVAGGVSSQIGTDSSLQITGSSLSVQAGGPVANPISVQTSTGPVTPEYTLLDGKPIPTFSKVNIPTPQTNPATMQSLITASSSSK